MSLLTVLTLLMLLETRCNNERRLWRAGWALLLLVVFWGMLYCLNVLTTPPKPDPDDERQAHYKSYRHIEEQLLAVAEQVPDLPIAQYYMRRYGKFRYFKSNGCAPFPSIYDLEYSNMYWQTLKSNRGQFLLYGTYLDARNASSPVVRILTVQNKGMRPIYCQFWFEERADPVFQRVFKYNSLGESEGDLRPYLLTCLLPTDVRSLRPAAVSLVEDPCDNATNCMRVSFKPDRKKEFAVCVKGLDFSNENLTVRLVKWIELVRLLGADKIFFYEMQVHPNISRVLEHYRTRGIVATTPITLPGGQPNHPGLRRMYLDQKRTRKRQLELVSYNDCLYRHMYQYRWLVLLDVDEVILPLADPDWSSLLKRVTPLATENLTSSQTSVYYVDDVQYLDHNDSAAPGFYDTSSVLVAQNYHLACLNGKCLSKTLDKRYARLMHYRNETDVGPECLNLSLLDAALWRLADRLAPRVRHVLAELGLLSEPTLTNRPQVLTPSGDHSFR